MKAEAFLAQILRGVILGRTQRPASVSLVVGGIESRPRAIDILGEDAGTIAREINEALAGEPVPVTLTLRHRQQSYTYKTTSEIFAESRATVVKNRVAVVTGGAQGFGAEIARGLVADGAIVYIADMNYDGACKRAEILNKEYNNGGPVAFAVGVNVSDEDSVAKMCETIALQSGGVDLCISNAGIVKSVGSIMEQDVADFRLVADVNYIAFAIVTKHVAGMMKTQHVASRVARNDSPWAADIIQINSKSGLEGSNRNASYAGSKFGGIGLVQSFAKELVEWGIKVNAICPGNFFDTPLWSDPERGLFVQYLRAGKVPGAKGVADVRAFYEAKVPMGRGCTGPDVIRAVYYLVEQLYETGQALPVTGGQVMIN
ncbi:sorbitol-6-phosphate 2-dehydrogenase [Ereboglobus sp. PH5-10]|uniref:SDR family NAD(P)-dependent oxidoreductase n=1 Tax=Ereboglobus sp. PH5-10 TaxID=2940629 RepID=UPI0024060B00|nr:SDR family NAD(P)-dependent oxidoreductase [Ereboglobus sp. PH5-10]MDF9827982.1 sorbitol-6-phosphate 2-dehydrogenase [Ereboglobus sp. PH5-10]